MNKINNNEFPYYSTVLLFLTHIIIGFIEAIIGLRLLLKFLSANANAAFVDWVYKTSYPLLFPFLGMFPTPNITNGVIIEFSALFALIIYALIGFLIHQLIIFLTFRKDYYKKDREI